jgi:hypothetical protein
MHSEALLPLNRWCSTGLARTPAEPWQFQAELKPLSCLCWHYLADNFSIVPDQLHGTSIAYVPHDLML